jgi:RND family efflux transporter MFP subunit
VGGNEDTLLTTIIAIDPIRVYFHVEDRAFFDVLRLKQKQSQDSDGVHVSVGLASERGYPHEGHLDFLDLRLDRNTGAALARAVIPNENGLLHPGLSAHVRLSRGPARNVVLVQERAIGADAGGSYVFVVQEDHKVEQRYVEPGERIKGMREVRAPSNGTGRQALELKEYYIVDGLQRARPGWPVQAVPADDAGNDTRGELAQRVISP